MQCRVLGDDHHETLTTATNLARDLHTLGKYQQVGEVEDWIKGLGKT
ncbi:MAG: hypothetical protein ACRDSR_28065 [Pseudonocardiaceae bacterium]